MKRTNVKNSGELKLKRRLELVRTTVRVLSPIELKLVEGGMDQAGTAEEPFCPPLYSP
jgi:hypothetical protein